MVDFSLNFQAHVEHDLIVLEVPKERTSKKFSFRFHRMPLIKKLLKPVSFIIFTYVSIYS
jgi:hypothetical protein